ncbi:putative E3 ubiquitin-protein ligase [Phytophthora fragariae]|uniref:RBR-type E3 ubiquitin transferase n=1 Tax=Phytophthora fragariae TaxID=53985 RepID=A0A6G0L9S6_9STRA|nr:putative E3 ubiquitin-protein ligase [Phytophthora fragariae]KAE9231389.1 putative E3 ubiquitin-protein ligase [Phytophthora fragariae]
MSGNTAESPLSLSDDEYHYSDVEEEDEYQYSEDEDEDEVASVQSHAAPNPGAKKQHAADSLGSGSAAKKKRLSPSGLGQAGSHKQQEYHVIDEEELLREQRALIAEISQVLEISAPVASVLLRYFGWNKEKLFEGYYADPVKTKHEAGVEFADRAAPAIPEGTKVDCNICCDEYSANEIFGMGCGHVYCLNCWKPYLSLKIQEGPICVTTTCPAHGCKEVVSDEIFKRIVGPEDYRKYARYLLRSFVDINKGVKWCPSAGCSKAITSAGGLSSVTCTCGCVFCLRCGEEAHSPVMCEQLAAWQEKCRNESETANWILANTKKCPKCSVRIEKNQGCNHMTCRSCNYEFCWICMEGWDKHGSGTGGYYKCNRYDADAETADTDAARAKAELDRYLHYYQRFANHSEAGKFAQRMREGTENRMIELQASHGDSSWIDVQFLNAATEQLIECRRVLKYTYVFGYYLPAGKEKNLFEYLQENLEKNAEHLTGLSEMPLDKMNRSEIINYTRVTETFLRNLLTGVEDGLTSNAPHV